MTRLDLDASFFLLRFFFCFSHYNRMLFVLIKRLILVLLHLFVRSFIFGIKHCTCTTRVHSDQNNRLFFSLLIRKGLN